MPPFPDDPKTSLDSHASSSAQIAQFPFDRLDADVVLRSADGVDFYVYKAILSLASSFFATMFSLEQPPPVASSLRHPVIAVSEDSNTLDALLRYSYPVGNPEMRTLEELDKVSFAAIKYDIPETLMTLRLILRGLTPQAPGSAFAVACNHSWEDEARLAAEHCRKIAVSRDRSDITNFACTLPGAVFVDQMGRIPAGAYYRLLSYIRTRSFPPQFCTPAPCDAEGRKDVPAAKPQFNRVDGDTVLCSSDGVQFRVHRVVLTINDAGALLNETTVVEEHGISGDTTRSFQTSVSADVLGPLLQFCYPHEAAERVCDLAVYKQVAQTAFSYGMHTLMRTTVQRVLREALGAQPLTAFLIAAQFGWVHEAQRAAELLATEHLDDQYSRELETTPASLYQQLLKFHHRCQAIIMQIFEKYSTNEDFRDTSGWGPPMPGIRDGPWKQKWFDEVTGMRSKKVKTIPSVITELQVKRLKALGYRYQVSENTEYFDLEQIITTTQSLESEVKAALRTVKVGLY
ncbi:hypothetical protein NM688_g209 [Phlebia brevispora]|uniref:Uncharacterized protein n=1 Tax=Phlebia brevispora TaxID=194682 RepID=A0ACC1TF60_9APHY|nr:hypothetical protein NM688_g209 [Phlebia brevispora]